MEMPKKVLYQTFLLLGLSVGVRMEQQLDSETMVAGTQGGGFVKAKWPRSSQR